MKLWILDLDNTAAHTTRDMQDDPRRVNELTLVDGVREFLDETKARGDRCVLVTVGEWALQMKKIQQLDLSIDYFILSPPRDAETGISLELPADAKLGAFERIANAAGDAHVVVVGDRLDRDIATAKRVRLTTVRVRLPEGKYSQAEPATAEEASDYTVCDFFELMKLPIFAET